MCTLEYRTPCGASRHQCIKITPDRAAQTISLSQTAYIESIVTIALALASERAKSNHVTSGPHSCLGLGRIDTVFNIAQGQFRMS